MNTPGKRWCLMILAAILFSAACGPGAQNADGIVAVTDDLGKRVGIPKTLKRIVTNYGIAAHMVVLLGYGDRLVAVDRSTRDNIFFNALLPGMNKRPSAGLPYNIDPETILRHRPDLVLTMGRNARGAGILGNHGIPAYSVRAETIESLPESVLRLGKALGREKTAERFSDYYNAKIGMIRQRLKGLKKGDRPLVYLTGPMGLFSTCSGDMIQHHIITLCGGRNAGGCRGMPGSGHGWIKVSPEQVIQWNPDVIVVIQLTPVDRDSITGDPRIAGVKAVRNRKIYCFPSNINPWDYPSPQAVLGIIWLAKHLHPERFRDINVLHETNDFFRKFYGKSFTALGGKL